MRWFVLFALLCIPQHAATQDEIALHHQQCRIVWYETDTYKLGKTDYIYERSKIHVILKNAQRQYPTWVFKAECRDAQT
jgi:hypothetical protein